MIASKDRKDWIGASDASYVVGQIRETATFKKMVAYQNRLGNK